MDPCLSLVLDRRRSDTGVPSWDLNVPVLIASNSGDTARINGSADSTRRDARPMSLMPGSRCYHRRTGSTSQSNLTSLHRETRTIS